MRGKSVGRILDRIASLEKNLVRYYAAIRDKSRDNDVRLLTYYLSRHRRHLPEVLKEYSPETVEHVRKTEIRRAVSFIPGKDVLTAGVPPGTIQGRELLAGAIRYDLALVALYRQISEQLRTGRVQEVLDRLIQAEERDLVMLKKMAAMDYF